jgi:hypothetical protein
VVPGEASCETVGRVQRVPNVLPGVIFEKTQVFVAMSFLHLDVHDRLCRRVDVHVCSKYIVHICTAR